MTTVLDTIKEWDRWFIQKLFQNDIIICVYFEFRIIKKDYYKFINLTTKNIFHKNHFYLLLEYLDVLDPFENADLLLALKPFESLLLLDLVILPYSSYSSTNLFPYPSLSVSLATIYALKTLRSTNSSSGNFLINIACLSS